MRCGAGDRCFFKDDEEDELLYSRYDRNDIFYVGAWHDRCWKFYGGESLEED